MKIREKLVTTQRRYLLLVAVAFIVWGGLVVGMALSKLEVPPTWFFVAAVPVFVALLFGIVGMNFLVRCPKCRGNLSRIGPLSTRPMLGRRKVSNCPFCGINLDTSLAP